MKEKRDRMNYWRAAVVICAAGLGGCHPTVLHDAGRAGSEGAAPESRPAEAAIKRGTPMNGTAQNVGENLAPEENTAHLSRGATINLTDETVAAPEIYKVDELKRFRGKSSRTRPPLADGVVISGFADSDANRLAVDAILSSQSIPYYTDHIGSFASGSVLRIVVTRDRLKETRALLTAGLNMGQIEPERDPTLEKLLRATGETRPTTRGAP